MVDHTERAKAIVSALAAGESRQEALKKAGFSDASSRSSLSSVFRNTPNLGKAVQAELHKWIEALPSLPHADVRAKLVRQRLVMNLLEGKDKAVQSAKLLGQDREVNMFEPENRVGIQVAVAPPAEWSARYAPEPEEEQGK